MARVTTHGLKETVRAVEKVQVRLDAAARIITVQSAALLEAEIKKQFQGSHGKGEPHVGGPNPNVVTGTLRRSVTHDPIVRYGVAAYGTRVGPTTIYGRRVELGYQGGGGGPGHQATRPFPYVAPGVKASQARLHALAVAQWARATQ